MSEQPEGLQHQTHQTDSKVPLIAYFDASDIGILGLVFFIGNTVTKKIVSSSAMQLALTGAALLVTVLLILMVKRLLAPYPKLLSHAIDWYSKPDLYEIGKDPNPVPLYQRSPSHLQEDSP